MCNSRTSLEVVHVQEKGLSALSTGIGCDALNGTFLTCFARASVLERNKRR